MQKIKKENGITLLVLIITIVVLLIIAGVSVYYATTDADFAIEKKEKIEIEIVTEAVREQYVKYLATGDTELLLGVEFEGNINNKTVTVEDKYKELSKEDLKKIGIENPSSTKYIVNYETAEVYVYNE